MSPTRSDDTVGENRTPDGPGEPWYGVYPALVQDIDDPDHHGRVRLRFPRASDDPRGGDYEAWARLATMMAGSDRARWVVPDVNDEVLVAFEGGDPRRPYVLGALWNGSAAPPEGMDDAGKSHKNILMSRNGLKITLDDQDGQEKVILETPAGQKLTMKDGSGSVELIDSNGNAIKLETSGVTVNAATKVTINASTVAVSAGMVTVDSGMTKFSGVVQADTLIANSVISASYTPGAGNIL